MKTLGDFSAEVADLHDSEIELLQFKEGGKLAAQCTLSLQAETFERMPSIPAILVGPLGLEPRTS